MNVIIILLLLQCNKKILISKKQKEHRLKVNKRTKLNNRDDIILQIKEYYKKIKKIKIVVEIK